jgi:putative hemolysin
VILATLIVCLLLSFLLSGLESAIFSVSVVRVRHRAKEAASPNGKETRLQRVFSNRQRLLTSVLLTNNALALVAFALATRLLVGRFGDHGFWIAFLVSLPVYILWCELVPKLMFSRFPYRALRVFVIVLELINLTVGQLFAFAVFLKPDFQEESEKAEENLDERARARAEFRSLAQIVARDGALAPSEKVMIDSVMNFRRTLVGDLMVPISQVTAIPLDMPVDKVVKLSRETGLNEFPIMSKAGDLIGVVSAFEIMRNQPQSGAAVNYLRRLIKVGTGELASTLVPRLRKSGLKVAAVCSDDEAKIPLGIITLEDILESMLQKT